MTLGLQLLHLRQLALSPGKLRFPTRLSYMCYQGDQLTQFAQNFPF